MVFNKVFAFNKKILSHVFSSVELDINNVDKNTLLFVTKKEYFNVPNSLKDRTLILSEEDIIEISIIPFKQSRFYQKNKLLHRIDFSKVQTSNHLLDLKFIQVIIEDSAYSINDKFHYSLLKAVFKKLNHIGIKQKFNRRMTFERYYKILNLITKNSYNRARFNAEMNSFKRSGLLERSNNVNFDIAKNDSFEYLHSIYSNKIFTKDMKLNRGIFLNNCIEFSYSKPLVQNTSDNMITTISQTTVANYYGLSQSQVAKVTKNRRKLYKFEIVSELEYQKNKFDRENEESSSYIFPIKTFTYQFNRDENNQQDTYYIKSLASKLFSDIKFKSMIKTNGKIIKLDNIYESSSRTKKKNGRMFDSLITVDNQKKYNITNKSNVLEFLSKLEEQEDTIKPKDDLFPFSSKKKDNTFQIIGNDFKRTKNKLITFINTLSYVKSIKSLGLINNDIYHNFKINLNKQINIFHYLHNITMSNINKLKTSVDNKKKIRNRLVTNFNVFHKFILRASKDISSYRLANMNSIRDLSFINSRVFMLEPNSVSNDYIDITSNTDLPW